MRYIHLLHRCDIDNLLPSNRKYFSKESNFTFPDILFTTSRHFLHWLSVYYRSEDRWDSSATRNFRQQFSVTSLSCSILVKELTSPKRKRFAAFHFSISFPLFTPPLPVKHLLNFRITTFNMFSGETFSRFVLLCMKGC